MPAQKNLETRRVGLRGRPALSYKQSMAETIYFPRHLILAGAMISGVLLALAVHMLGARFGLDLGGLWRSDSDEFIPAGAAIAWWLIATVGFCGGYFTGTLMQSAASGQIPQRMRQFLIAVGVLLLAGQRAEQGDAQHAAGLPGRVEHAGRDAGALLLDAAEQGRRQRRHQQAEAAANDDKLRADRPIARPCPIPSSARHPNADKAAPSAMVAGAP